MKPETPGCEVGRELPASLQGLGASIHRWAVELGFADAGIAHQTLGEDMAHLREWLAQGRHGGMDYMARNTEMRGNPRHLHPDTLGVVSARLRYWPDAADASAVLADDGLAYISRYALGRDYHRVMRARLLKLARRMQTAISPHGYRVLADSAPSLEKALARNAGLGWIGKNTLLLNRQGGSWFFLGEIYTDLPLIADPQPAVAEGCGRCRACLNVCPTQAFVGPYQLDARRCISYLTIEHQGAIPLELRPLIGNRIFGCDDCQLICPWNRHASHTQEPDFSARHGLDAPELISLFLWTESEWRQRTEGMALRRTGYTRWLRNCAVALGNAVGDSRILQALQQRQAHEDEMVREHVLWAIAQQQQALTGSSPPRSS